MFYLLCVCREICSYFSHNLFLYILSRSIFPLHSSKFIVCHLIGSIQFSFSICRCYSHYWCVLWGYFLFVVIVVVVVVVVVNAVKCPTLFTYSNSESRKTPLFAWKNLPIREHKEQPIVFVMKMIDNNIGRNSMRIYIFRISHFSLNMIEYGPNA